MGSSGLSGRWIKNALASESMDATADAFQLTFVARNAAKMVSVLEIEDTAQFFETRIDAYLLKITERYPKTGEPTTFNRRDLRMGRLRGRFVQTEAGHASIEASWDEPAKGSATDTFCLDPDGKTMTQTSTYTRARDGLVTSYKTVYKRS